MIFSIILFKFHNFCIATFHITISLVCKIERIQLIMIIKTKQLITFCVERVEFIKFTRHTVLRYIHLINERERKTTTHNTSNQIAKNETNINLTKSKGMQMILF